RPHPACLAARADRALRPPHGVERADRKPQPENQEHQADRPWIPQLRPLPAALVAQPRSHPPRSLTDANQKPRSQVRCVEPHYKGLTTTTGRSAGRTRIGTRPLTVAAARGTPSRPHSAGSIRTCLLLFRTEAAVRTHVAYMPDTTWPIDGHPPGSSRSSGHTPVLMSSGFLSTRQQRFTCVRLPGPHLTPPTTPFPHRSPRRSSTNAA